MLTSDSIKYRDVPFLLSLLLDSFCVPASENHLTRGLFMYYVLARRAFGFDSVRPVLLVTDIVRLEGNYRNRFCILNDFFRCNY